MKFMNGYADKTWCNQDMSKNRSGPLPEACSGGPQMDYDAAIAGMQGTIVHNGVKIVTTAQGNTWDQAKEPNKMA